MNTYICMIAIVRMIRNVMVPFRSGFYVIVSLSMI